VVVVVVVVAEEEEEDLVDVITVPEEEDVMGSVLGELLVTGEEVKKGTEEFSLITRITPPALWFYIIIIVIIVRNIIIMCCGRGPRTCRTGLTHQLGFVGTEES